MSDLFPGTSLPLAGGGSIEPVEHETATAVELDVVPVVPKARRILSVLSGPQGETVMVDADGLRSVTTKLGLTVLGPGAPSWVEEQFLPLDPMGPVYAEEIWRLHGEIDCQKRERAALEANLREAAGLLADVSAAFPTLYRLSDLIHPIDELLARLSPEVPDGK